MGKDIQKPVVTFTTPLMAASVSGVTTITVTATDNVVVKKVEFYVNGSLITTDTVAPFSTTYNFATDGVYHLEARAYDRAGNIGIAKVDVSKTTVIVVPPPSEDPIPLVSRVPDPPITHQGGEGSCVAGAVYRMASIAIAKKQGTTVFSNSTNILSFEYFYDKFKQLKQVQTGTLESCGAGASMLGMLAIACTKGACLWDTLPYSSQLQECQTTPCDPCIITAEMDDEASFYKMLGNYTIADATDKALIKRKLAAGHALGFTCQYDNNMYSAPNDPNYIWKDRGFMMWIHAMCLVGHDTSKKAYLIANSWGTAWANNGYLWVDEDFFASIVDKVYFFNDIP